MIKEFREFIMRGSMLDLAIGIVVGGAFAQVVNSFVNDILMPPIGLLLGKVDFAELYLSLSGQSYPSLQAAKDAGAATINYGLFINTIINLLIVGFAIFLIVKGVNRAHTKLERPTPEEEAEPTTRECPYCYSEIPRKATRCPNCTSALEGSEA
jgi:large conductance mechanosensitive channel